MDKLISSLSDEVVKPLFRRIGTFIATYIVASGVPSDTAETIVLGVVAGAGVVFDLATSHFFRKKVK